MAVGDSYYLVHDIDALSDLKISALVNEFGFEAYGLFWVLLERMFPEDELSLPYGDMTFTAIRGQTSAKCDIKGFVDRAIEYGLFERDGEYFYSPSLIRRMKIIDAEAEEKSRKARESANARWNKRRKEVAEKGATKASVRNAEECNSCATAMRTHSERIPSAKQPQCESMRSDANELNRTELSSGTSAHARARENVKQGDSHPPDVDSDPLSRVIALYAREIDPVPSTIVIAHMDVLQKKGMEPDVMLYAINEAAASNARNWRYVKSILDNLEKDKAFSMDAVADRQRKFDRSKGKTQGDKRGLRDNRNNFTPDIDSNYSDQDETFSFRLPRLETAQGGSP